MGKAKKVSAAKQSSNDVSPEVAAQVSELKSKAQQAFLGKKLDEAVTLYGEMLKVLPDGSAEKGDALVKRAGCYLQLKKFQEAVTDAGSVLASSPTNAAALKTRAKANQLQNKLRLALADYEKLNTTPMATKETREAEATIRQAMAGRPASAASPAAAGRAPPQQAYQITVKATLGTDSRMFAADINLSYAILLELIKAKFPSAGNVLIKFTDPEGDLVTVTSRHDIQVALQHLVTSFQRQMASSNVPEQLHKQGLPPLKFSLHPVANAALVPRPPANELSEIGKLLPEVVSPAPGMMETDEWLMDFVRLFTDLTGLDPSAHYESSQQASDKLQRGMQEMLASDESESLLDEAGKHYRDAAVTCLVQWGNTIIVKADRKLQAYKKAAAAAGTSGIPSGPFLEEVLGLFAETQAKVEEALRLAPDSWEAMCSLAQLEWERAKAKLGYAVTPAPASSFAEDGTAKSPEALQAEAQAQAQVLNKQLVEVLKDVPKETVLSVKPHLEECGKIFEKALALAKTSHEAKVAKDAAREAKAKAKASSEGGEAAASAESSSNGGSVESGAAAGTAAEGEDGSAAAATMFSSPPASVMVMHGNILYDWSQVLSITGAEPWKPELDLATVKFRASGAPELDVRAALKNHLRVEELDLGPDPEPEVPAPPAPAAEAKKAAPAAAPHPPAPEAKGLPSLEVKKPAKKAAAAAAAAAAAN